MSWKNGECNTCMFAFMYVQMYLLMLCYSTIANGLLQDLFYIWLN